MCVFCAGTLSVCTVLISCASTVTIKTAPKNAEVSEVPNRDTKATPKLIGSSGELILSGQQLNGNLYRISAPGYETVYTYFPSSNDPKVVLDFSLPKPLLSAEARLAQAENQVRSLTRILTETEQTRDDLLKNYDKVARLLVATQRNLNLRAFADAEDTLKRLFELPQDQLPAASWTLRGKLHLLKGQMSDARMDFEQAARKSPEETEAKSLLETVK